MNLESQNYGAKNLGLILRGNVEDPCEIRGRLHNPRPLEMHSMGNTKLQVENPREV